MYTHLAYKSNVYRQIFMVVLQKQWAAASYGVVDNLFLCLVLLVWSAQSRGYELAKSAAW